MNQPLDTWKKQINRTKLYPPAGSTDFIRRCHFIDNVNQHQATSLVLVRAPAGYGKSSAVGQWFEESQAAGHRMAWLSVDNLDNNLKRFVAHLVAAFAHHSASFGESLLGQLNSFGRPSISAITNALVAEIDRLDGEVCLVIDDFHRLTNSDLARLMALLVEQKPENLRLVIISRACFPFALSRLKASGDCIEFEADDLRFSVEEVSAFIAQECSVVLSPQSIALLAQKTEGWPAALRFTSLSLKNTSEAETFIQSFTGSHSDIAGFLVEEVLGHLPAATQRFLLRTSVLEAMCPELCNYVSGRDDSAALLQDLKDLGLFIINLDDENRWCRYHHLFSDFLMRRLKADASESVEQVYAMASRWCLQNGLIDEAIQYALSAGHTEQALHILKRSSDQMFYDGKLNSLVHWVEEIGEEHLVNQPAVTLNYAWTLILEWRFLFAKRLLNRVKRKFEKESTIEPVNHCSNGRLVLAHRDMMYYQFTDDMDETIASANTIIDGGGFDENFLEGNVYTSLILAEREKMQLNNLPAYDKICRQLYDMAGSSFVMVWHLSLLAPGQFFSGEVTMAENGLIEAEQYATRINGRYSTLAAIPALLNAQVKYEKNNLQAAKEILQYYLPIAGKIGTMDQLIAGFVTQSRLLVTEGDIVGARRVLQKAEQTAITHNFTRFRIYALAELMQIECRGGDRRAARSVMNELSSLRDGCLECPDETARPMDAVLALSRCRLLRLTDKVDESIQLAKVWMKFCDQRRCNWQYLQFALCVVHGFLAKDQRDRAVRSLRNLLQHSGCFEFVNSFFEESGQIVSLLRDIAGGEEGAGSCADVISQAQRILVAKGVDVVSVNEKDSPKAIAVSNGQLTPQEMTVLLMISQGQSNKEIGRTLTLTEGTVKWVLQSIFSKLGVRRRGKAVMAAKEAGLIK